MWGAAKWGTGMHWRDVVLGELVGESCRTRLATALRIGGKLYLGRELFSNAASSMSACSGNDLCRFRMRLIPEREVLWPPRRQVMMATYLEDARFACVREHFSCPNFGFMEGSTRTVPETMWK